VEIVDEKKVMQHGNHITRQTKEKLSTHDQIHIIKRPINGVTYDHQY